MEQASLRSGFTTGTCAAAAAKAAAVFLMTGECPKDICITTPKGTVARLAVEPFGELTEAVYVRVQKDAGDDPDVTNGAWVYAKVSRISAREWELLIEQEAGYHDEMDTGLYLMGGAGIGKVTRPGLQCPVGKYAINPVPRAMIFAAVAEVKAQYFAAEYLNIQIAIPEGRQLAAQTFNPRLGIEGGISILGTSGVVEPMSEPALLETIRLDVRMKVLEGAAPVIVTPGNYGETFLRESLQVPLGEAVKCSNFIADSLVMLEEEGALSALYVGHIGKFIKVTGGVKNTHSRYGDRRMELLEDIVKNYAPYLTSRILAANTTEEVMGILVKENLGKIVLDEVARSVQTQLMGWLSGKRKMPIEVVTFSSAYGILGKTNGVEAMLKRREESSLT